MWQKKYNPRPFPGYIIDTTQQVGATLGIEFLDDFSANWHLRIM